MNGRMAGKLAPLLGVALFAVALWVLHRALAEHHYHDIVRDVLAIPPARLALAFSLTILSYLTLTGYDALALRYVARPLGYPKIALASFIGYAFSHNIGHTLVTGGSVRFRLYSAWGLSAVEIAKVVGFCVVTFWVGFLAVGGIVLVLDPPALPGAISIPTGSVQAAGVVGLAFTAAYWMATVAVRRPLKIREWEFVLPSPRLAGLQVALASIDWVTAAGAFAVLVPESAGVSIPALLGVFLLAQIVGLASQIPGGLGVFESVVVAMLAPTVSASMLVGTLLAYRIVYYLVPLALAAALLGVHEALDRRAGVERVARWFGFWVTPLVPHILALGAFVGGTVLLFSGATPAVGSRMAWLKDIIPLPVLEVSHFLGSVTGVGLLLLARSLQQRVDGAYFLAVGLLSAGIVTSFFKGFDYEEAIILGVMLAALLPCRRHFYRRASLIGERFTPGWTAAISLVLMGATWLGFFSYKHLEYSHDLWWHFSAAGDAPRYLRATVGGVAVAVVVALAHLLRPAPAEPSRAGASDLSKALPILEASRDTSALLGLLGDKSFLFNAEGTGLVMYGVSGRSWVALGDPVGPESARRELAWAFRELSDRHGGWTVFYQVRREHLHLYLDVGLSLVKLGEEARVPLQRFTLEGGGRKGLRHLHHRLEKEGVRFEIIPADRVPLAVRELETISDAWLADKRTREKSFSLGAFRPEYVSRFPIAVARRDGRIVAFANVWRGAEREELSVDLMRHLPDAPRGVMEFLFVELMRWGQQEGYQWFNLGMAPLSGLENRALAPLWTRLGAFVFRHGEHFYNFQGLREYKEKFDPVWEPKYLASPGGFALPRILTDIASLISGGLKGVVAK